MHWKVTMNSVLLNNAKIEWTSRSYSMQRLSWCDQRISNFWNWMNVEAWKPKGGGRWKNNEMENSLLSTQLDNIWQHGLYGGLHVSFVDETILANGKKVINDQDFDSPRYVKLYSSHRVSTKCKMWSKLEVDYYVVCLEYGLKHNIRV